MNSASPAFDKMKPLNVLGPLAAFALVAMALSGCVREEIGPRNFHTTAYIERPAAAGDESHDATPPSVPDDSSLSGEQTHH